MNNSFLGKNYTALLFLTSSFFTLLYALFISAFAEERFVSLSFSNTFISLDKFELAIFFKIALFVIALGYYLANRLKMPLNSSLTLTHTIITLGCVLINAILLVALPEWKIEIVSFWLITVATAAQLLFIANLAIGVRKRHIA
ncbi:hypothetical protein ACLI1A_16545 [Flavobacterium sp. RHBU_3]|uniref:hypothetical protein n=1 Tax=Flavobacterium sp. RHBU_3 TaxID=3391184 RepID=UPI003984F00A